MRRTYIITNCCANCDHRKGNINSLVVCNVDDLLYHKRVRCNFYKGTQNKHVLSAEYNMLPKSFKAETSLDTWLVKEGISNDN